MPENFSPPLKIRFQKPDQKYSLVILETKTIEKTGFQAVVTGYKTGLFESSFAIEDGGGSAVKITPLSWQIDSVLKSQEIKPHPPYGPWGLSLPLWYQSALTLLLASTFFMICFYFRKFYLKKKIQKRVQERLGSKSAVEAFIHTLSWFASGNRKQGEEALFLKKLRESLRDFLENQFLIPKELPEKKMLKQMEAEGRGGALASLFLEIGKMEKNLKNYSFKDFDQILSMARDFVFQYEKDEKK